ncbi:MAG: hypothetical protein JSS64_11225 [Bacteroidetes bacterium]|nr:hypothetical protein [Bacteroidota bacterium]
MKYVILSFLFLFLGISSTSAQIIKLKANEVAVKTKDNNSGRWSNWSDPQTIDVLILVDGNQNRVKIFSKVEQAYDIIKTYNTVTEYNGKTTHKYECIDKAGTRCNLSIVKHPNGISTLEIEFSDANILYNIYKMD